jgi:hypothetical protein
MRAFHPLVAGSVLAWLAGCNNSMQPSTPTSPASPSLPTPQTHLVSGTVSETVDGISRPVTGRKVDFYMSGICEQVLPVGGCAREKAGVVETDQNGRYTFQVQAPDSRPLSPKPLVYVTGSGLHALGQQPCLASALVDRDTTLDMEVFQIGSPVAAPPAAGPMITGFVYEATAQGPNPLRGVYAWLEVGFADSYLVARTQTDDAGRFFFCRVNAPVWMGVGISGYQDWPRRSIPGTGDMFFEIELRR